jgi:hypothetical protein
MDEADIKVLSVSEARQLLGGGDIRNQVAFQQDVNRLLAALDDLGVDGSSPSKPFQSLLNPPR